MNLICYFAGHDWYHDGALGVVCLRCRAKPYDDYTLHEATLNFWRFALKPKVKRAKLWLKSRRCWRPGHHWNAYSDVCQRCGMTGIEAAESGEWMLPEWRKLWRAWLKDLPRRIFGDPDDPTAGKWYLAGPMSGRPKFNIPVFDAAAKALRAAGFKIISPAELDEPELRAKYLASADGASLADTPTWGTFLSRDVKIVADDVRGIVLLPGWEKSRGARLEAYVGLLCGHQFLTIDGSDNVRSVRRFWIKLQLWRHL